MGLKSFKSPPSPFLGINTRNVAFKLLMKVSFVPIHFIYRRKNLLLPKRHLQDSSLFRAQSGKRQLVYLCSPSQIIKEPCLTSVRDPLSELKLISDLVTIDFDASYGVLPEMGVGHTVDETSIYVACLQLSFSRFLPPMNFLQGDPLFERVLCLFLSLSLLYSQHSDLLHSVLFLHLG